MGRRVLIIDDHVDGAEMLAMLLSAWSYDVRTAHDGASALSIAPEFQPEIAFVDLHLPDIDGAALADRLRALPGLGSTVLVALTGDASLDDDAGRFAHHVVKPATSAVLKKILSTLD